ncbi:hypothetical protein EON80_17305 [bacterium]|nr:MAG: hypothetical protein EON80_17305 [bacterium]
MFPLRSIYTAGLLGLAAFLSTSDRAHAEDIKVVRTMVSISNARFGNYYANPAAKTPAYNTWCWLPRSTFYLKGDMPPGASVSIEYGLPDGKPWLTVPTPPSKVGESNFYACGNEYSTQEAGKRAKTIVGTFPFKIRLKSPLEGTNKVLYSGKYTVTKFHKGNALPAFKNQFEYVVDQDWRMGIAYVAENYSHSYSDNPSLQIKLYLKGQVDKERLEGVLFHEGKIIASKELRGSGFYSNFILTTTGMDTNDPLWSLYTFELGGVRMRVPEFNKMESFWYLSEHPGEYEFKVLRNGQVSRSVKFKIGANGVIDDGGKGKSVNDDYSFLFPAKVLGTTDGKWNALAIKNNAFYGNPITGF